MKTIALVVAFGVGVGGGGGGGGGVVGGGGGKDDFAQGGGSDFGKIDEALKAIKAALSSI